MTMTTPTPEALRHRAAARRWALALMVLFTVASMAFNVVIAARHGGAVEDLVLAGLAPAVLASMGHLLAKFVQAAIEASGVTSHVYWAGVAGVSVIGLGAFILSFENLQTLAARQHNAFVSSVFPVTLDLAILVSTGIHVVIGIANERDQAAGVEPYRGWLARRFGWRLSGDDDTAAVTRRNTANQPVHELVYPSTPAWLTAPGPRHDADQEPVDQPDSLPEPPTVKRTTTAVNRPSNAVVQPDPQVAHEDVDQPLSWDDSDTGPVVVQVDQQLEPEQDRDPQLAPEPVNHRTLALVDQSADRDVDHRGLAEQVVQRTTSDWTVDQLETVSRSTPGRGQRVLAEELDVSPSTVNRMRKALAEVASESDRDTA